MIRAFSARHLAMTFIPGVRSVCRRLSDCGFCHPYVQPIEILRMHGATHNIRRETLALLFRRLSLGSGASTSRRANCGIYIALERGTTAYYTLRFRNSQRGDTTLSPPDAPRNIRRNGQARQAPAEYTPPPYAQHTGRVRLIWFSFSSFRYSAICRL